MEEILGAFQVTLVQGAGVLAVLNGPLAFLIGPFDEPYQSLTIVAFEHGHIVVLEGGEAVLHQGFGGDLGKLLQQAVELLGCQEGPVKDRSVHRGVDYAGAVERYQGMTLRSKGGVTQYFRFDIM